MRLLASPDPAVRIEAATALGFERAPGSTPLAPLEDLLSSDPDVRARRAAAAAIGRLGRKEGLGALSRAVGSGDAVLRAVALAGIAHIRGEKMERLADREKLTAAELAELSRALSQYTLDRVVVSGGKAAAVIVSPDGTKRLVMKGEKVAGGFALTRIVRRGEQASPGGPPAERAVAVLERAGAKVILEEP